MSDPALAYIAAYFVGFVLGVLIFHWLFER